MGGTIYSMDRHFLLLATKFEHFAQREFQRGRRGGRLCFPNTFVGILIKEMGSMDLLDIGSHALLTKYEIWGLLKAPRRLVRMQATASKGSIPSSIRAMATNTGALPKPATQWTAIVGRSDSLSLICCSWLSINPIHSRTRVIGGYKHKNKQQSGSVSQSMHSLSRLFRHLQVRHP